MKNRLVLLFHLGFFFSANSKVVLNKSIKRFVKGQSLVYQKNNFSCAYSKPVRIDNKNLNNYIWVERNCPSFNEMLLTWNAFRPKKGKFSFFVSVGYEKNWSPWHKISEWADKYQKTFLHTKNNIAHTKHVRLELQNNKKASAFRVKVLPERGALISDLKALSVTISDMNKFNFEKDDFNEKTIIVKGVPKISQWSVKHLRAKDFCSPTSVAMILAYYSKKGLFKVNLSNLAEYVKNISSKVHDDSYLDIYGAWPLNVAQAFDSSRGRLFCSVERLNGIKHLYSYLRKGMPVAVSVRGNLRGGFKRYDNGHFIVVVGWDKKRKALLCMDPAFTTKNKMLRAYNLKDFIKAWGTSRNLAYIISPKKNK